jgi:hypothetical protein
MRARIFEAQADLFEIGILSQTAEVEPVSVDQLLANPQGPALVIVGAFLAFERLVEMRRLWSVLGRSRTAVVVVPPFGDLDLGRYFETPVGLRVQRRSTESTARVLDAPTAAALGDEVKIRSDHFLDTALGAGVVAVDARVKPVLIRHQTMNTWAPVFFSALQVLTYTALTNEAQRQSLLTLLLSSAPAEISETSPGSSGPAMPTKDDAVGEKLLVPVALLLAAGGPQTDDQLRARARTLLGADLGRDDVRRAVEWLGRRGLITPDAATPEIRAELYRFIEQRGMHPYLREIKDLLASEETTT